MTVHRHALKLLQLGLLLLMGSYTYAQSEVGLVNITQVDPTIQVDMRYASTWNFTGRVVPGYLANACWLTPQAANALAHAQANLRLQGFSLQMLDCYRPQRAVRAFVLWAQDPQDTAMQHVFYPTESKSTLIQQGYIGEKSTHSRGSTVDLTLTRWPWHEPPPQSNEDCRHPTRHPPVAPVDMGTEFDCFSPLAHMASKTVSQEAQKNRLLLKTTMEKHGFVNYAKEWWHFSLKNEPNTTNYYDVEVGP